MSEQRHFALGPSNWEYDAIFYSAPEDGGLALKDVMHSGY